MANLLTAARVLLIFFIIAVWARDAAVDSVWLDLAMVPLLAWAIFMDALDGWAARRFNEESEAGALLDIAGDRIVELALWTFFAVKLDPTGQPLVALWVPMVMIARTVVTDVIRSVAFGQGRTPFGESSMQRSRWAKQLTSARWSRALYGGMKAVAFCGLGLLLARPSFGVFAGSESTLRVALDLLVGATVAFSIARAIPVVWDGRRYVTGPHSAKSPARASDAA